jgi:hypothetical protein
VIALSPLELLALVTNKTSSFDFDVTVDKFDGGMYVQGETISVNGVSKKAGYLSLLSGRGSAGTTRASPIIEVCNPSRVPAAKPFSDASAICKRRRSASAAKSPLGAPGPGGP